MLYSDSILKKGALARVWQAAHLESKLTKQNILQADIEQNVKDIIKGSDESIGLRVSGSLLLGVCRIYYRKANYLLADCTDALVTIKMQIRPAIVDLPEDQLAAPRNEITRNVGGDDFGLEVDWSTAVADFQPSTNHVARPGDINLAGHEAYFPFEDFDDEFAPMVTEDGFFSQDFDLGLLDDEDGLGDGEDDETMEMGRDAVSMRNARVSMGSAFAPMGMDDLSMDVDGAGAGRASMGGAGGMDLPFDPNVDLGFMDNDFDMDAGGGYYNPEEEAAAAAAAAAAAGGDVAPAAGGDDFAGFDVSAADFGEPGRRPSTPPTEGAGSVLTSIANMTPTTAARVSALANKKTASTVKKKGKKTVRVIVDENTELAASQGAQSARNRDLSSILTAQRFIPSSSTVIRLLQIRTDPLAHYLPSRPGPGGDQLIYTGPPGLGKELADLFYVPAAALRRRREGEEEGAGQDDAARKRARTEEGDEAAGGDVEGSVEAGRRDSRALSLLRAIERDPNVEYGPGPDVDFGAGGGYDGPEDMGGMPQDEYDTGYQPFDVDDPLPLDLDGTPKAARAARRRSGRAGSDDGSLLDDDAAAAAARDISLGPGADAYEDRPFPDTPRSGAASSKGALGLFDTASGRNTRRDSEGPSGSRSQRAGSHRTSRAGSAARSVTGGALDNDDQDERERARNVSRNTSRALGLLRKELGDEDGAMPVAGDGADNEPKALSFEAISQKSTKRAASAFFFELLLLGTKDAVKLDQPQAYGDISVQAKPKLWELAA